jgi:polyisoprenyl-phosphate glycosyltransferase
VWVWVLAAVLFLSGVQLTTMGILGRYMARVHAEVLARPLYVVDVVVRREPPPPGTAGRASTPATAPAAR